jgi:transcriptional regulator with XRE-family HTH domain
VSLGNRIKTLRRASKLTQKDVAARLEVDHTTVSKWEADIYEPNTETLDKLATLFETTVDRLLGRPEGLWTLHNKITAKFKSPDNQSGSVGRAFFGGSDKYTEEELDIARAAAQAAIEAYRRGKKSQEDK